jgi:hypothetical protein
VRVVEYDYSIGPRAQSADEAGVYLDDHWTNMGLNVATLSTVARRAYDDARRVYVNLCANRRVNQSAEPQ